MFGPPEDPPPDFKGFLRFILFVLELDEIPRGAGQYFRTLFMHRYVVFDPDPPDARQIHTRFYRNHVSRGKLCFLPLGQPWVLVYFQSQAMPGTMHEILIQLMGSQNPSCRGIDLSTSPPRPDGLDRRRLRFQHRLIPQAYPCGSLAHIHSSRDVAAVFTKYSTQV